MEVGFELGDIGVLTYFNLMGREGVTYFNLGGERSKKAFHY